MMHSFQQYQQYMLGLYLSIGQGAILVIQMLVNTGMF
jgi:hypothetical protein